MAATEAERAAVSEAAETKMELTADQLVDEQVCALPTQMYVNPCVCNLPRCVLTLPRCVLTLPRCVLTLPRCVLTLPRCVYPGVC
jgi:hypothetical protein